jgi:hypothetical protein
MVVRSGAGVAAVATAAALGILSLLLAGCRMPPFDEDLSLAVHTMSQLDHAYTIGPVEVCDLDSESELLFMPGKFQNGSTGKVIDDGLVVETRREETIYVHVSEEPGEDYYVIEENANNPLSRFSPRPPGDRTEVFSRYVETVVETSGSGNVYALSVYPERQFSGDSIFTDQYEAATADFNTVLAYPYAYDSTGWFGANEGYIGAGVYPAPTAVDDLFLMLTYDDLAGEFYEYAEPVDQDGLVNIPPTPFNSVPIGAVDPPETVFYYHHPPSRRSYMSYSAGGGFKNWILDAPAGATEFTPLDVSGRIARVLSTGELLVRRKRTMSLYGPTGESRGSFAVGDLRLAFEYYNGDKSRYETVFTYIYFENRETGDCDTTAYARVYTIPTAKLDTLD